MSAALSSDHADLMVDAPENLPDFNNPYLNYDPDDPAGYTVAAHNPKDVRAAACAGRGGECGAPVLVAGGWWLCAWVCVPVGVCGCACVCVGAGGCGCACVCLCVWIGACVLRVCQRGGVARAQRGGKGKVRGASAGKSGGSSGGGGAGGGGSGSSGRRPGTARKRRDEDD